MSARDDYPLVPSTEPEHRHLLQRQRMLDEIDQLRQLANRAVPAVEFVRDMYTPCEVRSACEGWLTDARRLLMRGRGRD